MIDTDALRSKIIDLAIQGKLTEQLPTDGNAEDLYQQIQAEKAQLIKDKKIKKEKSLPEITAEEIPFDIPSNWKWVRIGNIFQLHAGKNVKANCISDRADEEHQYLCYGGNGIRGYVADYNCDGEYPLIGRQGALCGNVHLAEGKFYATEHAVVTDTFANTDVKWAENFLKALCLNQYATATAQPGLAVNKIEQVLIPLPPLAEQKRIVDKIDEVLAEIKIIDELQSQYASNVEVLKSKIIDAGIRGQLTEQLPEDGTAEDLYQTIQAEKAQLIKDKKIKKEKPLPEITADEIPFEIPDNWKWVRLGEVTFIERGGSPRPIKQYLTDSADGINWIKIGDVEKGGKYIFETKEKIIAEGEKKSRRVYPGDFLLTNSMSFGRPYISKIEGCIHDGWLVIRDLKGYFPEYLYYLLSSSSLYNQFCNKASGSTVNNLNIDKVNNSVVTLPPLAEQKRIVAKIDEVFGALDARDRL